MYYEKELQKTTQTEFRMEKVIREKVIVGLIKKIFLHQMSYFPEPYIRIKNKIKAELYLANYTTKSDIKDTTGVHTSRFLKKADLVSLKPSIRC